MDYKEYFKNIDLEKTDDKDGIHFEQKTTPDLIWAISQSILDFIEKNKSQGFSEKDIRQTETFETLREEYFSKPEQDKAKREYDKFCRYQLKVLTYAEVLSEISQRPKKYKVEQKDILKNLALNDLEVNKFLGAYVEKFIKDNDLEEDFNKYKRKPNQENYEELKDKYWEWAQENTGVRTKNPDHSYRVFNKIFNLYAHHNKLPGESRSRVKEGVCPYNYLIYNRPNFRDEEKPTDMPRKEFEAKQKEETEREGVMKSMISKAKQAIRNRHPESEVQEESLGYYKKGLGVNIHRIFPETQYPQLSFVRENMIAITPGQHYSLAHPKSHTQKINKKFQIICLIKKLESIKESIEKGDGFYKKIRFIRVLNEGLNWDISKNKNFEEIRKKLKNYKDSLD